MELRQRPEIAVVELGMNHAGEISTLVAHRRARRPRVDQRRRRALGFFASLDAIADAKAEILEGATPATRAGRQRGRRRGSMARARGFAGRVVTFGIDRDADVRATDVVDRGVDGTTRDVSRPAGEARRRRRRCSGAAISPNVLAATAVALELGVPLDDDRRACRAAAAGARIAARSCGCASGVTVIDDCYNASPAALRRALEVLGGDDGRRARVAVLGEMLELGDRTRALHASAAARRGAGVDLAGGRRRRARRGAGRGAVAAGMPTRGVRHFATSDEAADAAVARSCAPAIWCW